MSYSDSLKAEAQSWVAPDAGIEDKLLRERVRHPGLIRTLMLDRLPTHRWDILEVGGGPLPVSDLLPFRNRVVVDPCTEDYRAIAPCPDHVDAEIERFSTMQRYSLVISTNSLDHVRSVPEALKRMDALLLRGGYMAILCAENNAFHHPHPSHRINLTLADIHRAFDAKYETVHERSYQLDGFRYGWLRVDGICGQPAFAWVGRKAYE